MKWTVIGTVIFLLLIAGFFGYFGGLPAHLPLSARKSWVICAALFVVGAATACFGDHEYGMFPPASLRWLFIIAGILAMAAGSLWMRAQTQAWALPMEAE